MAISFSCPSCDSGLKLRDELAGRKVKCPRCGDVIAVPAEQEEGQTEQPRKKKKKNRKKKSSAALISGIVAGLLLLVGGGVALVVAVTGGKKNEPQAKAPAPPPAKPDPPAQKGTAPRPGLISAIARRVDRPQRLNELRQIALFYESYRNERGKPPSNLQEFTNSFKREAPDIVKAIEENYYVVVLNVRGSGIIAYEKEPDIHDEHAVAKTDASVNTITSQQLKAELGIQGG
jgi:hypothetical protein